MQHPRDGAGSWGFGLYWDITQLPVLGTWGGGGGGLLGCSPVLGRGMVGISDAGASGWKFGRGPSICIELVCGCWVQVAVCGSSAN